MIWGGRARQGRLCGIMLGSSGPVTGSLFPLMPAWVGAQGCRKRMLAHGLRGQASTQVPCSRVRPRLMRLRRLRLAVRRLSQELLRAVPR
jgi:transposase